MKTLSILSASVAIIAGSFFASCSKDNADLQPKSSAEFAGSSPVSDFNGGKGDPEPPSGTSSISGKMEPLPSFAEITVVSAKTNHSYSITSVDGIFTVGNLPSGTYNVKINYESARTGASTWNKAGVVLKDNEQLHMGSIDTP